MKQEHIGIAGSGLVGSLLACLLAKEGYRVTVFERRPDPRTQSYSGGRSINLALSDRGWKALAKAGLDQQVRNMVIPMKGRMMHSTNGELTFQPYGKEGQAINSVPRGGLNKLLMEAADQHEHVTFKFGHRCTAIDFEKGIIEVEDDAHNSFSQEFDAILGADGAFSAVRSTFQKTDRFNFEQHYIPHGYKELTIYPKPQGGFQLDPNALHIWPRQQFMLIALPNQDETFTCTLFLAFEGATSFENLNTKEAVTAFFQEHFADTIPLIKDLEDQFLQNPTSSLVTVKCSPWKRGKALLVGDAAHAIVPFYGQGMNAGFEDCSLLMETLEKQQGDWEKTFQDFSDHHAKNGHAIAELALKNFIEMRDSVADEQFLLQKRIEAKLHQILGEAWMPLYSMVTFSHKPYSQALATGKAQQQIMNQVLRREDINDWDSEEVFSSIVMQVKGLLEKKQVLA